MEVPDTENAESLDLHPGDLIDEKFRVEAVLGKGGFGVVLRVCNQFVNKEFALKILTVPISDRATVERFKMEARAFSVIKHPAFVETFDSGSYRNQPYIVMEYLEGQNLGSVVRNGGALSVQRGAAILAQVAYGLEAAHTKGIIHRDIKGENIFLLPGDVVKILDLGIAKFINETDHSKTHTGAFMGTPYTMSPEQIQGANYVEPRSDIYSLAVLAFYVFSGRWPYTGEFGELLVGHARDPVPWLSDIAPHVPTGLSTIIRRNMSKSPHDRDRSMRVFADSLAMFASVSQPGNPSTRSGHLKLRRHRVMIGGGLALAAIAGAVFSFQPHRPSAINTDIGQKMLPPEPVGPAADMFKLMVDVTPQDAVVEVDGRRQAGAPPYLIDGPNGHVFHVTASKEGFSLVSRDVRLASSDVKVVLRLEHAPAPPPPAEQPAVVKGRLDVIVDPYALVYVDGKKVGQTPQRGVSLPVGSHTVKLVNAEYGHPENNPFEKHIQIRAGRRETIDLTWTK